ncbi:transposable element Tcb1 transposase [Trichonephila clavipes]|nr:transposable element Tcb1 transposase [Trichonephila clavipes]
MTVMDHAANHEPQHSRFSLLSIIRCPLVPFDAVFRRVEMSARRPLRLPLTGHHRNLRRNLYDELQKWTKIWNDIVFTDESRFCLQHHDGRIRLRRHRGDRMLNSCVMHRHTGPEPSIVERDWISLSYPSVLIATTPNIQCYICEVLEPVILPYIQCLPSAIFQPQSAQPHVERNVQEFFAHPIGFCFLGQLVLLIYRPSKMSGSWVNND